MGEPAGRTFDGSFESVNELFKLHPQGIAFYCPVCGDEVTVILNWEEARQHDTHPGVFCPRNKGHVYRLFNLKRPSRPGETQ